MLSSLARFIGKIAVISLFPSPCCCLKAQFHDSVFSSNWPIEYSGDTSFFLRSNQQIISNYNQLDKGDFQLKIKIPPQNSSDFYVRFNLELKINTSTNNSIQFGFIDAIGNTQFIKLGNTQDRWEAYTAQNSTPINAGPNQEFSASAFKGSIQLRLTEDSLFVTTYHISTQRITELKTPLFLSKIQQFFIGIQQSGKTAFQSHRISNIQIDNHKKRKFLITTTKQLNQTELRISGSSLLKSTKGILKINHKYRFHSLNSDLQSLIIQLEKSDTLDLNILIDSFYTIWNEPMETLLFNLKLKKITPVKRADIVISEIMPVPEPSLNRFPTTEYIELYNNSNDYKQATEIILTYNNKVLTIPDSLFAPKQAILLVPTNEINTWRIWTLNKFQSSQGIWGIPNFPNLINAEGTLLLTTQNGLLLDSAHYQVSMHSAFASSGGFSYETHNLNPLSNHSKWKTASYNGGSPGALNGNFCDEFPIEIEEYFLVQDNSIAHKLNIHNQLIEDISTNPKSINIINQHPPLNIHFDINPQFPKPNLKLTFNEIYFKSATNTDFIEIYNPNECPVFLEYYDLLIYDKDHYIKQIISLKNQKRKVIMPKEYLVLCENLHSIIHQFDFAKIPSLLGLPQFPNLTQEGGYLALVNQITGVVDECSFEQVKPINRTIERNASIEKSHPNLLSNDPLLWFDCVSNMGASPTISNSMVQSQKTRSKKWTNLSNKRLLKNSQGYYDLPIELNIPEIGCLISIQLFSIWGEKILSVCEFTAIPSEGVIQWPLMSHNKELMKGNYIITFEILNPNKGVTLEHHRVSLL